MATGALAPRLRGSVQRAAHAARQRIRRRGDAELSPFYGASYFGERDDAALSGYESYDRTTSNANTAAYLLWRFVPFTTALDIGCAKGFVVEALCELGRDAHGCDISRFAIDGGPPWVRPRLKVIDLESESSRRQLSGQRYSLVTLFEVLEHLRPEAVLDVLAFVRTLSDGYVVATIPSFGTNRNGPPGFPDGKVRDDRLEWYLAQGESLRGPIPMEDLKRDRAGNPLEGHLTMASFDWWTEQFAAAGFVRIDEIEQAMQPVLGRFDLTMSWNLYVFHVDGNPPRARPQRSVIELATIERRWQLDRIPLQSRSRDYTRNHFSDAAAAAIEREFAASVARQEAFDRLR